MLFEIMFSLNDMQIANNSRFYLNEEGEKRIYT